MITYSKVTPQLKAASSQMGDVEKLQKYRIAKDAAEARELVPSRRGKSSCRRRGGG
jgi:hypothetical protein